MNDLKPETLFDRYLNGETEAVYEHIYNLGAVAFSEQNFPEVERVMKETFQRVSFNLEVIYNELIKLNYVFWKDNLGKDEALLKPENDITKVLDAINKSVSNAGHIPLSLIMFYEIVGSCDFSWNYNENTEIIWEGGDPIQIVPLQHIYSEIAEGDWLEEAQEWISDPNYGYAFIDLAADSLHKDNVSGGSSYGIELTKVRSIDSRFINEPNNTLFINYLRICFKNCGFPGMEARADSESFRLFCDKVKPQLKQI